MAGLRAAGRQVIELHGVGGGVPDLLVVWPGGMVLMEVKNPNREPGRAGRMEESQKRFFERYRGPRGSLIEVRTLAEALAATGIAA